LRVAKRCTGLIVTAATTVNNGLGCAQNEQNPS
jgi:hypothetical protein